MGLFKKLFKSEENEQDDILEELNELDEFEGLEDFDELDEVEDTELVSDDEICEELLEDGEFSYDNYDEVCCPECGEYLGEGVTVCNSCGYNKEKEDIICPNCGRLDEDHQGFCSYCDYEFKN
jgi:4-hydroxy-3-methylbut-2-en-1-yl diphosphate synthase IspG/GcpE